MTSLFMCNTCTTLNSEIKLRMSTLNDSPFLLLKLKHGEDDIKHLFLLLTTITILSIYYNYFVSYVTFTHSKQTIQLTLLNEKGKPTEVLSLMQYIRNTCAHLAGSRHHPISRYSPTPFLFSGHFQTMWASLHSKYTVPLVTYTRENIPMEDGGEVSIDWVNTPNNIDNIRGVVVFLHGLTGSSQETYIQDTLYPLAFPGPGNAAFKCVVMNCRGCGNSKISTAKLYSASYTEDFRAVVNYIQKKVGEDTKVMAIAFSMGGNILLKYLGEEGPHTPLVAAVSISNPYCLLGGARSLERTMVGKYIYSRGMAKNLIALFSKHKHVYESQTEEGIEYDYESIVNSVTTTEFDQLLTKTTFGFTTVNDYYRNASCAQYIPNISVPSLLLSALDDPVCLEENYPYYEVKSNPYVILATTKVGGHIGWYEGGMGWFIGMKKPTRWFPKPVTEYVNCIMSSDVVFPKRTRLERNTSAGSSMMT